MTTSVRPVTPNVPLLRKTLAHIEANPETWFQPDWQTTADCGTAYCFAGHAANLNGAKWASGLDAVSVFIETPYGTQHISLYAREALRINGYQASALFHEGNTLDDLRRIVGDLCEAAEAVASDG